MTKKDVEKMTLTLTDLGKQIHTIVPEEFGMDRTWMMYKIKEMGAFLRDWHMILDMQENPDKVIMEYTKKQPGETNGATDIARS